MSTASSAADLVRDLRDRGVEIEVLEGRLRLHPKSAITPKLADRLREHKAEIIEALAAIDGTVDPQSSTALSSPVDFSTWIPRPDFDGNIGLEPPDLPEEQRLWAYTSTNGQEMDYRTPKQTKAARLAAQQNKPGG